MEVTPQFQFAKPFADCAADNSAHFGFLCVLCVSAVNHEFSGPRGVAKGSSASVPGNNRHAGAGIVPSAVSRLELGVNDLVKCVIVNGSNSRDPKS